MAAPAYTEDLTDIDLSTSTSTGVAINFSGGGGGAPALGADTVMQGTDNWDRPVSTAERGIIFNQTPGAGVVAAGVHIFQWIFNGTPVLSDTIANRGAYVVIGTGAATNLVQFHVEGSNTYGAAGRVGRCYPIRYVTTANTGSSPYRTVTGTAGATPTYFGAGLKTTGAAKGSNLGVDAVRYGTGAFLTAGELISAGDGTDNPCTFIGFQAQNDAVANRWGILTLVGGAFELQGAFVIGQNNAGTATLARFRASDRSIVIPENPHVLSTFNKFIIDHSSTRCEWNNINILALGTTSRGSILVNNASTVFLAVGGVWESLGTITLAAAATLTGVTMRLTDTITLGGGTLTGCLIDRNRAASAVSAATLANITDCEFLSDGSNHAVELSSIGGGSMDWDGNILTSYVSGAAGSPVTPTATGNEAIYVNVGSGTLTINVLNGATVPSIRSAGATVNVVAGSVTTEITVTDTATPPVVISSARVFLETSSGAGPLPFEDVVTITQTAGTATVAHTAHGMVTGNYVVIRGATQNGYNKVGQITVTGVNAYTYAVDSGTVSPATGSPIASGVIISGLTNGSGIISDTRTFGSNQPFKGWARKSSGSPYYQQGAITGTISSTAGFSASIALQSDE